MPHTGQSAMGTPPPRRVPEPFLRAEITAFPLASEESFRCSLVELDPHLAESTKTGKLWRACESQLAPHTGWSLDRLVAARDRGWFGSESRSGLQRVPMHEYLRTLACSHLVRRRGVTEIEEKTDLTALDAADHYRWLTLSLPEDLLLCALGIDPAPARVDLDPPLLIRRLIDLGVAEIHQHIGGSMDFPLLWASALAAIATPDVPENMLASPMAPLSEGKNMVRWLLVAAVARCVLAEYLIRGIRHAGCFRSFVDESFPQKGGTAWTPRRREMLEAALRALASGKDEHLPDIEPLRDLYADIHPIALTLRDHPLKNVDEAFRRCDPIAVRLDLYGKNSGERWFLRNGLAHLDGGKRIAAAGNQYDDYFSCIFWQVIRVRCQYYRTVVQRPLTGGLQWFIRFYGRLGALRVPLDPIQPQISYSVAGEGHRIRALEFRTHPPRTSVETGERVLEFLQSWKQVLKNASSTMLEPEMGIIFHFVKERDEGETMWKKKGLPAAFWTGTHAEPDRGGEMDVAHGRYADYFVDQCRKARALAELIEAVPSSLWVIRGLDVANDELGVPTWVLAPLFRYVLDVSAQASMRRQHDAGPPLRITAHVGEDFRHLLEGMRRIYEHVYYILGNANGRLGHAIALGTDPQAWAESIGSALMPAEERLWDLVWEWRLYTQYRIKPEYAAVAPVGRVDILVNEVRRLSGYIYGKRAYPIEELAEAHHMLHRFLVPLYHLNPEIVGRYDTFLSAARRIKQGSGGRDIQSPHRVGRILETYLGDEDAFRRGQMLIDVAIRASEVDALNAVQRAMRRGIAQRGIVVEVNPSSNLLVGDMLDLRNHPILNLNPPVPEPDAPPPVAIAVGSDDPLTFSTGLLREYTLLHQAACAAGYPEPNVQAWLESIRRTGMDGRFTKVWQPNAREKVETLMAALRTYLHLPSAAGAQDAG